MSYFESWNVSEQTCDMYVCIDCLTEITKELYDTEKLYKNEHRHFRVTINREFGTPSWHPYFPPSETPKEVELRAYCTLLDNASIAGCLYMTKSYPHDPVDSLAPKLIME